MMITFECQNYDKDFFFYYLSMKNKPSVHWKEVIVFQTLYKGLLGKPKLQNPYVKVFP